MHLTCVFMNIFVHSSSVRYPLDLYYRNNTRVCLPVYPHGAGKITEDKCLTIWMTKSKVSLVLSELIHCKCKEWCASKDASVLKQI